MAGINSAALDLMTAVVCGCVCACMCVLSFITQVQLACPRVPGTVQCLGTKRADETAFCWQSGELGHLWSSIPEGRRHESKHPRGAAHMDTYCLNTHDTPQAPEQHDLELPKWRHRFTLSPVFCWLCVCINYKSMCLCVKEKHEASFWVDISEAVLSIQCKY